MGVYLAIQLAASVVYELRGKIQMLHYGTNVNIFLEVPVVLNRLMGSPRTLKTFCFEALFDEVRQRCPPGVLGGSCGGLAFRCCRTCMQGPPQNPPAVPFPHPPYLLGSHGCCKRLGGCCRCRAFPHLRRPPRPFGPGLAGLSPSDSFSSSFLLRARLSGKNNNVKGFVSWCCAV